MRVINSLPVLRLGQPRRKLGLRVAKSPGRSEPASGRQPNKVGAFEMRLSEVGKSKMCLSEVGALEMCFTKRVECYRRRDAGGDRHLGGGRSGARRGAATIAAGRGTKRRHRAFHCRRE